MLAAVQSCVRNVRVVATLFISETRGSLSVVVLLLRVVTPATHPTLSNKAPPTKHKARDSHDSSPHDSGLPAHVLQAHLVPELFELLVRQVDIEPAPQTQHAQRERQESLGGVADAWARKASVSRHRLLGCSYRCRMVRTSSKPTVPWASCTSANANLSGLKLRCTFRRIIISELPLSADTCPDDHRHRS